MKRREFIRSSLAAAVFSRLGWAQERRPLASLIAQQTPPATAPSHFADLAEADEAHDPLLAGHFEEALKALIPAARKQPGIGPYTIAVIYMRMERYAEGIPYALQACRDVPGDIRHLWMLRALTLLAGRSETTIPVQFRLQVPPVAPANFHLRDVTNIAGVGRTALGRGVAWGDFDNDGREDILVGAERAPFRLLRNLGNGTFQDVTETMGLHDPVGVGCYASQFIDYDNDGFQDIFLTSNGWGGGGRLFLFHNEGGRRFRDVTQPAGLAQPVNGFGSAWADYDNDGHVDLAVATGIVEENGDRIRLYHNEGNGKFREVGAQANLQQKARWICLCWGDYDGDGRQDLLAASFDQGPFLFRNLGNGRFEDVSLRTGVLAQVHAYTCEFFDYDNDGKLDIFVSTYPDGDFKAMIEAKARGAAVGPERRQLLLRNAGNGTFENATKAAGITGWYSAMSSQVGDLDNDGFDEIILGTGNPELDWCEPKPLFHNDGRGQFKDVGDSSGLLHFGMLHGIALADYDDSGTLSLFGSFGGYYWGERETSRLYRNLGTGNSALELRLVGTRSNRDAIGAKVSALVGKRRIFKWVDGGNGFGCGNSRRVHLGVGCEPRVSRLEIQWPSGLRQSFENIPTGRRIEILEGKSDLRTLAVFPAPGQCAAKPHHGTDSALRLRG